VHPRGDPADPDLARDQILGRGLHAAGDDQPRDQAPVMTSDGQLLLKRQIRPAVHANTQQERARRRGDLVLRELASALQAGAIRGN